MQVLTSFGLAETHGILAQDVIRNQYSSEGRGWCSLFASSQVELPFDGQFGAVEDQLIVWHRDGPVHIEGESGAKPFRGIVPAGGIHLIPGGSTFSIRLAGVLSTMHVYVRRKTLLEVAAEIAAGDPDAIEIQPGVLDQEAMLLALMKPVEMVLESDTVESGLCADYLALSLAAYLIEYHSTARLKSRNDLSRRGPVSSTVSQAIAFMRANLDRSIGLEDIARAVERSASHLARTFKTDIGVPPHRYLMRLRVEKAQELLANTNLPIAEVAAESGFTHQEHLTHQFRRFYHTTPAAFRRSQRN